MKIDKITTVCKVSPTTKISFMNYTVPLSSLEYFVYLQMIVTCGAIFKWHFNNMAISLILDRFSRRGFFLELSGIDMSLVIAFSSCFNNIGVLPVGGSGKSRKLCLGLVS